MEWSLLNFGVNQDPGYNFHKTSLKFEANKYKQSHIVFLLLCLAQSPKYISPLIYAEREICNNRYKQSHAKLKLFLRRKRLRM